MTGYNKILSKYTDWVISCIREGYSTLYDLKNENVRNIEGVL